MEQEFECSDMLAARDAFKEILKKMKRIVDELGSATDAFAGAIKAKLASAALALVEELNDIIEDTKDHVEGMNDLMGKGAEGLMEANEDGAEEIDAI